MLNSVVQYINKRLRFSISFKMTTIYTLIFSFILMIVSLFFLLGFRVFLIKIASDEVDKSGKYLLSIVSTKEELPTEDLKKYAKDEDISITVFNDKKKLIFSTDNDKNTKDFFDKLNTPTLTDTQSPQYLILNKMTTLKNNSYYIQLTRELNKESAYTAALIIFLFLVNGISIIFTAGIISKTSKKMLLPIKNITETTKVISAQALHTRLDVVDSHDELKDLAETINEMLDRIEQSYEQQNRFVSDASHELRTPIAVIQGYINLLYRWGKEDKEVLNESIEAIKSESENMKDLVEKLLFLARTDKNTQKLECEEFPIDELIDEIVKETRMIDSEHKILCDKNEGILFLGDRKLLKQAMRVFIDNSIKYTPSGGSIKINSFQKNSSLTIQIEDSGIGISKEDLPYIFDRFYRCDKSRTKESGGNGLGLSIAKWIIGRHNGGIEVESAINVGTKIIIYLPISHKYL
jgi:two-component system, OmpR family, sensor histidine kinase ArlS